MKKEKKPEKNIDDQKTFLIIFSIDFRNTLLSKLLTERNCERKYKNIISLSIVACGINFLSS